MTLTVMASADILWRDNSGHVGMWLMKGTHDWCRAAVIGTAPTTWSIVGTGDFNRDGKADILWRDTSGNIGNLVHERHDSSCRLSQWATCRPIGR